MFCVANHNHLCHVSAEVFLDSNLNLAVIDKNILTKFWKEIDKPILPYKVCDRNI